MRFKSFASMLALLAVTTFASMVSAQQIQTPKQCNVSPDPVGCLLDLAKNKAFAVKNKNEQVDLITKVLIAYANLNRTDFELVNKADAATKDKKLELDKFLDLQMALTTYFVQRDPQRAKKYERNATLVYFEAIKKDNPKDREALVAWACGLMDGDSLIWKSNAYITAASCTPQRLERVEKKDEYDEMQLALQKMNAAWSQSDDEELAKQKKFFDAQLAEYEAIGIKNKNKALNEATQYIKVLSFLMQTEMSRRSGQMTDASKLFAQAVESLNGLEKFSESNFTVKARVFMAEHHNVFLNFDKSIETLNVIADKFESKKNERWIEVSTYIDYLTALATALDKGNIPTLEAAKLHLNELRMRQADVLYERYLYLKGEDKNQKLLTEQALLALSQAAEAGHPLAMHNLAIAYKTGQYGLEKNLTRARYWYQWSAVNGFAGAQNNLGDMYENGEGVRSDLGMAIYWYTQAAMQGEPTAYLSLGELFLNGNGVAQNYFTAAFWLSLAAKYLPEGQNMADAIKGKELAISKLDAQARRQLTSRLFSFTPLKQSKNLLSDRPKLGESL